MVCALRLASLSMNSTPRRHLAIANSGKLPVQAPTKFELVIKLKATMDPLTDIYNHRHFEVLVSREFARAQRQTPEVLESLWEQSVIRSLRKVSQEDGNDDTGADSNFISFPDRKSA